MGDEEEKRRRRGKKRKRRNVNKPVARRDQISKREGASKVGFRPNHITLFQNRQARPGRIFRAVWYI